MTFYKHLPKDFVDLNDKQQDVIAKKMINEDLLTNNDILLSYSNSRVPDSLSNHLLQSNGDGQDVDALEETSSAREWIFKKQAIYCATLENLALGKTNLSKSIAKSASRFILRPTIIEGTPAQLKEEYSGFRGTKKANYVSTFLQRKKLAAAFQINWSQIQNPLLELKIRKKWIEKSKECKFFQNKGHISMSPTGSLPALELDLKKFQGSSRCIPSFPKPRKLTACNICPIVTGLLKHDMSQQKEKSANDSAQRVGDNVTLGSKATLWKRFRNFDQRSYEINKFQQKELEKRRENRTNKCSTNAGNHKKADDKNQKKNSFKKKIGEVFSPFTCRMDSLREFDEFSSGNHVIYPTPIMDAASSDSNISAASSTTVPRVEYSASDTDNSIHLCYKNKASTFSSSCSEQDKFNIIPHKSLGPVKSKLVKKGEKEEDEKASNATSKSVLPSTTTASFRLPSELTQTDNHDYLGAMAKVNEESESQIPEGARKQLPNRLYPADARNIAENSAKNSSESQKKRNRLKVKNRRRTLDLKLQESSSLVLTKEDLKQKPPKRKKKPKSDTATLACKSSSHSVGSDGDDEREDEEEDDQ